MDQESWNQIYNDLERDVAGMAKRGSDHADATIFLLIDRARFAIDKGDNSAAIAIIQDLRSRLGEGGAATRDATPLPTEQRLDALEDLLHGELRMGSAKLEIVGEDEAEEELTRNASQNAKVKKSIKYEDIADELEGLFKSARIRDEKRDAVRSEANRVIANRAVYEEIEDATKVPWWFTGLIHGMECSFSLNKHLHNGDSLKARTWQVPAGRPKTGNPPFTFHASACDALECDGFAGRTDWELPMVLYRLERYNGFGYRKKFGTASPYLWSYTNHFTSGKYVKDGVYDPNATSKQCGAAAMLRDLMERGVVSFDAKDDPAKPSTAPTVATATATTPSNAATPTAAKPTPAATTPGAATPATSASGPSTAAAPAQPAGGNAAQVDSTAKPTQPTPAPMTNAATNAATNAPTTTATSAPTATPAATAAAATPSASAPATSTPTPAPSTTAAGTTTTAATSAGTGATEAAAKPLPSGVSPAVASALSALAAATKPGTAAAAALDEAKTTTSTATTADAARGPRK